MGQLKNQQQSAAVFSLWGSIPLAFMSSCDCSTIRAVLCPRSGCTTSAHT